MADMIERLNDMLEHMKNDYKEWSDLGPDPHGHRTSMYEEYCNCLLYTSPSPRDVEEARMPSSA